MKFDRDEVEAAFRTYWQLGAVNEDWDVWCDTCFTEDVVYIEHILGNKQGRETVRNWGNGPEWTQGAASYAESAGGKKGA